MEAVRGHPGYVAFQLGLKGGRDFKRQKKFKGEISMSNVRVKKLRETVNCLF